VELKLIRAHSSADALRAGAEPHACPGGGEAANHVDDRVDPAEGEPIVAPMIPRPEVMPMSAQVVQCGNCGSKNRVPAVADGVPRCGNCHEPLPWIAEAGDENFADVVEKASLPVLIDFWAPWCGPCRMVSPVLEQLAQEMAGRIKLVKVNVDLAARLSRRFDVQHIPTLMVMYRGEIIARQPGAAPAPALRSWLEDALRKAGEPARQQGH
jgi:thioredoxin 2